mmetsp:Transcript_28020/g.63420  ORF Transcript_28020/g.63420 Transcript_28020/m.63420 type:complete len:86 (-) Transcript_28020:30-287(-)
MWTSGGVASGWLTLGLCGGFVGGECMFQERGRSAWLAVRAASAAGHVRGQRSGARQTGMENGLRGESLIGRQLPRSQPCVLVGGS